MKPTGIDERLEFQDEQAVHLYANSHSFFINPEEICIGYGIHDVQHPAKVIVHSYIHMTLPNFLRFAENVQKQVEVLIDKGVLTREPTQ